MGRAAKVKSFFESAMTDFTEQLQYKEVVDFVEANHRNPSRHRIEEHDMLNWGKANRKRMNAGEMKPER